MMDNKRLYDLNHGPDPQILTNEEYAEGWHWCPDWDYLMIGPESYEWVVNADESMKGKCPYCDHEIPKS